MARGTMVFGPAYLDRVLRVDRPLLEPADGGPLDQSVDGRWEFGAGDDLTLTLVDPADDVLEVELPADWPGPTGRILLSGTLNPQAQPEPQPQSWRRRVRGISCSDDLGGMGAGFAAAFGAELVSALGALDDPTSQAVSQRLAQREITHHPIRIKDQAADWTLLISSGPYGDKLPVGFRGCHAALDSLAPWIDRPCGLRVVAALPNALAARTLRAPGADVRFFAPTMRNMLDRDHPIAGFAESIDVLCCNRHEWEQLGDREEVAWRLSVLAITEGADGCVVRFTSPTGEPIALRLPAFPRSRPPRDTNRAGEAFASALIQSLLNGGWTPGVADESLVRRATERATAAAALVLDRLEFGFPTSDEVDAALAAGKVE